MTPKGTTAGLASVIFSHARGIVTLNLAKMVVNATITTTTLLAQVATSDAPLLSNVALTSLLSKTTCLPQSTYPWIWKVLSSTRVKTAGRSDASLTIDRLETNNQSPVIEPPQAVDGASFEGSKDVEIFSPLGSRSLELHCFKCADIIHACERKCATRGACRQPCLCFYRNIKKCHKCPVNCNCVHVCPRWSFDILSDEQRQLDNGSEIDDESLTISPREAVDSSQAVDPPDATYDSLVDDQSGISEEHNAAHGIAGVPIPFEPCVYCSYSINACKKMCATPGACDQVCVCYNDSHNRNCARCSLLCNREHIGPRVSLSLAQRRFDNRLEQNDKSAVDKQPEAEDQFLIGTAANGGGA
jgi:hypothetical protein